MCRCDWNLTGSIEEASYRGLDTNGREIIVTVVYFFEICVPLKCLRENDRIIVIEAVGTK